MALWFAAVNKVEKQSQRSRSRPIERAEVERLKIQRSAKKTKPEFRISECSFKVDAQKTTASSRGVMSRGNP